MARFKATNTTRLSVPVLAPKWERAWPSSAVRRLSRARLGFRGNFGLDRHLALQRGILGRTPNKHVVITRYSIPFHCGRIEISERALAKLQRHRPGLAGLQKHFFKALQLFDWSRNVRVLLANVELGNLLSRSLSGICNLKGYAYRFGAAEYGGLNFYV